MKEFLLTVGKLYVVTPYTQQPQYHAKEGPTIEHTPDPGLPALQNSAGKIAIIVPGEVIMWLGEEECPLNRHESRFAFLYYDRKFWSTDAYSHGQHDWFNSLEPATASNVKKYNALTKKRLEKQIELTHNVKVTF